MSRSPPPPEALIVAHGQPSDPNPPEALLAAFALRVGAHLPGWTIRSATLAATDALERSYDAGAAHPIIYPLFMADGWFVRQHLPRRLAGRPALILPPLGLSPDLPDLAARHITEALNGRGWQAQDCTLLLAAHGSARGPRAAQSAEAFAQRLRTLLPLGQINTGFVEQAPRLADAASGLGPCTLCLPFFALGGEHVTQDIPQALAQAKFAGPTLDPLGLLPGVPELVAQTLTQHANRFIER